MKSRIILLSAVFVFFGIPYSFLAQDTNKTVAQNNEVSEEIIKAVGKAVDAKLSQLKSYYPGRIESYDPETQTASIVIEYKNVINGELKIDSILAGGVPVFAPIGGNISVSRGGVHSVFFRP